SVAGRAVRRLGGRRRLARRSLFPAAGRGLADLRDGPDPANAIALGIARGRVAGVVVERLAVVGDLRAAVVARGRAEGPTDAITRLHSGAVSQEGWPGIGAATVA